MGQIYQLKVTINHTSPSIWRRMHISSDCTFFDLHVAIQNAMGWTDSHLHSFSMIQRGTARAISIEYPNPEREPFQEPALDETKEKIAAYFGKQVKQCIYTYYFGDNCDHAILLEKVMVAKPGAIYPQCVAGKNACPPEDCGGIGGYENLQIILRDPKHPEHEDMREWLGLAQGGTFDPTDFDPAGVEFENPLKRLQEYRNGFEQMTPTHHSAMTAEIESLKKEFPARTGTWEMAQVPELIFSARLGRPLVLTVVADRESHFIILTKVSPAEAPDDVCTLFIEAAHQGLWLPKKVITKNRTQAEELRPLLESLNVALSVEPLKTIPHILKEMRRALRE